MSQVVVCGSLNMDVIVQTARRPQAGETILDGKVSFLPGGKGSNQAVAAARLGANTAMLGAVGEDVFGETLRGVLKAEGVDASGVKVMRGETTGVAVIQVAEGDNAITGAAGANARFTPKMVARMPRRGDGVAMVWRWRGDGAAMARRSPRAMVPQPRLTNGSASGFVSAPSASSRAAQKSARCCRFPIRSRVCPVPSRGCAVSRTCVGSC